MIERILDRLFKKRVIVNCDREPYLHRWYLFRTQPFAIFIHKFIRSDEDRALHDHPWNFIVIPIWRGYIEHYGEDGKMFGPFKIIRRRRVRPILGSRFRRGTYRHRVALFKRPWNISELLSECQESPIELPSWSIFIRFREFRTWGFHLPEGWKAWDQWWREKCE